MSTTDDSRADERWFRGIDEDDEPTPEYECTACPANSREEPKLSRRAGRACPWCGEGVIQLVED